jgi:hypothetical protein
MCLALVLGLVLGRFLRAAFRALRLRSEIRSSALLISAGV